MRSVTGCKVYVPEEEEEEKETHMEKIRVHTP